MSESEGFRPFSTPCAVFGPVVGLQRRYGRNVRAYLHDRPIFDGVHFTAVTTSPYGWAKTCTDENESEARRASISSFRYAARTDVSKPARTSGPWQLSRMIHTLRKPAVVAE